MSPKVHFYNNLIFTLLQNKFIIQLMKQSGLKTLLTDFSCQCGHAALYLCSFVQVIYILRFAFLIYNIKITIPTSSSIKQVQLGNAFKVMHLKSLPQSLAF